MKNSRKPCLERPNVCDADSFIVNDKMIVAMRKNFTKKESKFIIAIITECMVGKTVKWRRVAEFFESDCDEETLIKKIKNHYYNVRSAPARVITKKNNHLISLMGLDI